jgi:dihydrofolate reductase
MRKLVLKMSLSLDGFVAGPTGEIDWIFRTSDDKAAAWEVDVLWRPGLHIMGSRTFHDMFAYWPGSAEPFAPPMNEIPKAAFSRKGFVPGKGATSRALEDALRLRDEAGLGNASPSADVMESWTNAEILTGDLALEIASLKARPGKDIMAHGGAGFAQSLIRTGLIDEYLLMVHPVALGRGLPIFSELPAPLDLRLVELLQFPAGVVAKTYRPA